jgi:hypothetical protein
MQKYLFMAIGLALILMSVIAFQEGKPTPKAPIYQEVKKYSPYYLDKRFGGLQIMNKNDKEFKEKPKNVELFRRLDYLEKAWGKNHLKLVENQLSILDDNKTVITTLPINSQEDSNFLHSFYGI